MTVNYKEAFDKKFQEVMELDLISERIASRELKEAVKMKLWQRALLKIRLKLWKVKDFFRYVMDYGKYDPYDRYDEE